MSQIIAVINETNLLEKRVALTPSQTEKLIKIGFQVSVESDCATYAGFTDEDYEKSGAKIYRHQKELLENAQILVKVTSPNEREIEILSEGSFIIAFVWPAQNAHISEKCAQHKINLIAMDCVPRISRAQSMDALSSMANIAGYRAVIEAAHHFGRFLGGQITAAGAMPPAKVLIIGAGVAGLAAIAAAKSLGAIVRAFDTRMEVRDQITSLGGEFLYVDMEEDGSGSGGYAKVMSEEFIKKEMELFHEQAQEVDIIITTALIPGKPAPLLITREMIEAMQPGGILVDLAAAQGGNCELTKADTEVVHSGITILGYTNLPSRLSRQSSELYATNLVHLFGSIAPNKDGQIALDMEDVVHRGATVVNQGEIIWPAPPPPAPPVKAAPDPVPEPEPISIQPSSEKNNALGIIGFWLIAGGLLLALGSVAPADFMSHFSIFVLSIFIGWQVIWNVSHSLHTPLMAVTNAISGIIVIGALVQLAVASSLLLKLLTSFAVLIATINIVGGFFVTHRMLKMFRK